MESMLLFYFWWTATPSCGTPVEVPLKRLHLIIVPRGFEASNCPMAKPQKTYRLTHKNSTLQERQFDEVCHNNSIVLDKQFFSRCSWQVHHRIFSMQAAQLLARQPAEWRGKIIRCNCWIDMPHECVCDDSKFRCEVCSGQLVHPYCPWSIWTQLRLWETSRALFWCPMQVPALRSSRDLCRLSAAGTAVCFVTSGQAASNVFGPVSRLKFGEDGGLQTYGHMLWPKDW